jgi:UDP-GlcNAc:undecaprenyl-phosphate GlcNAc-1-phosphate transferase
LNVGFTHLQASIILVGTNLGFIALALALDQIGTTQLMLVVILTAQFISAMFWLYDAKRNLIATNKAKNVLLPAEESSDISMNTAIPIKKVVSKEIKEELLERLEDQKS